MNTTFTDGITVVTADWLNDVNDTVYGILGDGANAPTTGAQVLENIGGISATDIGVTIQAHSDNLDEFATVNPTAAGLALLDDADAAAQRTTLGLGTAAVLDVGTTANKVVQLDGTGKLPAVDGSQLTGITGSGGGATGGGTDEIFYENGQTVTTNYTLTSGKNAGTFGPVSIADGVTVTVPAGATWSIV